jgi:hypothetical protein
MFGMWTNNPLGSYRHLVRAIDRVAARQGGHDITRWTGDWRSDLVRTFEQVLRASTFGYWGDAKARAAGRVSRTQKILSALAKLSP